MRAVICFNPHVPLEHAIKGNNYSEASLGFDFNGTIGDMDALAAHLRELADALTAPAVTDPDLT